MCVEGGGWTTASLLMFAFLCIIFLNMNGTTKLALWKHKSFYSALAKHRKIIIPLRPRSPVET